MALLKTAMEMASGQKTCSELVSKMISKSSHETVRGMMMSNFDPADTLKAADVYDNNMKFGKLQSVVSGIPISVKDNFNVATSQTSAGSRILNGFISSVDATPVHRLRSNGAILCARANMDEFGMGSSMLNSAYGICRNPWTKPGGPALTPGGSSGGSAALVASGIVPAALASDTGGSVRQPASFCGVVGFKPTYGMISRFGLVPYASSMDTPGIITQSVTDAAIMLDAVSGIDSADMTSIRSTKITSKMLKLPFSLEHDVLMPPVSPTEINRMIEATKVMVNLKGLVVGLPMESNLHEISPTVRELWQHTISALEDAGAEVREVSIPSLRHALPCYYLIACAEASSNLARYDGIRFGHRSDQFKGIDVTHANKPSTPNDAQREHLSAITRSTTQDLFKMISKSRGEGFGSEVIKRILTGTFVLSNDAYDEYYGKAAIMRKEIQRDVDIMFRSGVHLLLSPTTPELPFFINSPPDVASMMINDTLTVPANLCGSPAISIPVGIANRCSPTYGRDSPRNETTDSIVPVGMQIMGPQLGEIDLLRAALAIEQRMNFDRLIPSWVKL